MPSPLSYAEKAVFLDKKSIPDAFGGVSTQYVEGAEFDVLVELSGSVTQLLAEQKNESTTYNITVHKDLPLDFHSVFKLRKGGRILRVTVDPDSSVAPKSSTLDFKVGRAEEYVLPI